MNKSFLLGRLARDPSTTYTPDGLAITRYTLAVNRMKTKNNEDPGADFIQCVAFGKSAEFAEKYFKKGTKLVIVGRIQTGSYTDKDGNKVYTTEIVIEQQEFAESKGSSSDREARDQASAEAAGVSGPLQADTDGFMNIPEGIEEELPFN